jgi:hypothetical protein
MISIRRSLARQLRSVCRRAFGVAGCRKLWLQFQASESELVIRAASNELAIEYHQSGAFEVSDLAMPLELLARCAGKSEDLVALSVAGDGSVTASWKDRDIPQQTQGDQRPKTLLEFPSRPTEMTTNEAGTLRALVDASETTDSESTRYTLGCVNLRGTSGSMAATNGRQLLVQDGFQFPWSEDVLVPASKIFASPEFPSEAPVAIGRNGEWAVFGVGPWMFWIRIQKEGRFPKVDDLLRKPAAARSHLSLDPRDAEFAVESIKWLQAGENSNRSVTLDLNGQVLIRSQADPSNAPTELSLARSSLKGEPVRLVANSDQFSRALAMGFTEFQLFGPDSAIQASDARRYYITMPFSADSAVLSNPATHRINSLDSTHSAAPARSARKPTISIPVASPEVTPTVSAETVIERAVSPIEQLHSLRATLREALVKTGDLVRTVQRQNRQSRLVKSTLQSLKQLQTVA